MGHRRPNKVTQLDIARLAGVSQSTVSRVMAGDPKVEPELRERVLQAARLHSYLPDARAQSLRRRESGMVGLVIKRPRGGLAGDAFFSNLIGEIMDRLHDAGSRLCLELVHGDENEVSVHEALLRSKRVDGVILVESVVHDSRLELLQRDRFPFVLIGNPMRSRVWSVDNDNVAAGALAAEELIRAGYRRIAMLAGPPGITVSEDRILGYSRALDAAGMPCRIWHSDFGIEAARLVAEEALAGPMAPDALVVLDDLMAMGVVLTAREQGLSIPDDLGLVSFNDTHLCHVLERGLTSVSLNIEALVREAVDCLMAQIRGEGPGEPRRILVPCELKRRGSSAPLPRGEEALR